MNLSVFSNLLYTNSDKVNDPQKGLVIGDQKKDYFIAKGAEQNSIHLGLYYFPNKRLSVVNFTCNFKLPRKEYDSQFYKLLISADEKYLF